MSELKSYSYAVVRVVPRVDRDEFVNAGVIVFAAEQRYLGAEVELCEERLLALWPNADIKTIERHLRTIPRICAGDPSAGPIARLGQKERFHWLTSPRNTVIQISPVRSGLSDAPELVLERLKHEFLG